MMNKSLGFIGIGLMGQPITLRLLAAGYTVNIWNRSTEKLGAVITAGAVHCTSIADLMAKSDIILLCLADTPIVEKIVNEHILVHGSKDN
ncbi:hypothetical protein BMR07_15165 [Methylococcaceae bacterium CS1]|nr:NAD(P)-binding domain-containing protein [Methyloprofundus sp.]TXK97218.1 hypothetical protein BMR11_10635 [Methylococcaceae bacterium CS5]TXL03450.1 hypothetical protein BMR07_15165 [Methylococcaceae bacterium CS1]TXL03540.1 hypothetical protein BMR09_14735 [Methylococcaceae bacterium CS3]